MMDNDLRLRRFAQEAADEDVAVIMMDVVLGEGAHPDPASELAPAIEQALDRARRHGHRLDVVMIVVGSEEDAQGLDEQVERLTAAGAIVFQDTIEAVNSVREILDPKTQSAALPVNLAAFQEDLVAINVGLETFHDSLAAQGARVVQVEWRPPAGGNEALMSLLDKMRT